MSIDPLFISNSVILPFGVPITHSWIEIGVIIKTIEVHNIKRFVELGVHRGGLASCFITRSMLDESFWYLGTEIDPAITAPTVVALSRRAARSVIMFADNFNPDVIAMIKAWLEKGLGKRFIYCDGGNKPAEFDLWMPFLRPGDVIGVHDLHNEIMEDHFVDIPDSLHRIRESYLIHTRIALFVKR